MPDGDFSVTPAKSRGVAHLQPQRSVIEQIESFRKQLEFVINSLNRSKNLAPNAGRAIYRLDFPAADVKLVLRQDMRGALNGGDTMEPEITIICDSPSRSIELDGFDACAFTFSLRTHHSPSHEPPRFTLRGEWVGSRTTGGGYVAHDCTLNSKPILDAVEFLTLCLGTQPAPDHSKLSFEGLLD